MRWRWLVGRIGKPARRRVAIAGQRYLLAGLERCETPYLVTGPCDTPNFPPDLVERLAQALQAEDAEIAMAATMEEGQLRTQPVFCLLKSHLMESLVAYLQSL